MTKLPKILEKEPLVDAIFEVRFSGQANLADILPGFLLSQYGDVASLTRLPSADIPLPVRQQQPGLNVAPIHRLELPNFTISIGDTNIVVGCRLPYPKWPAFKAQILDVAKKLTAINFSIYADRYSLKYVNVIEAPTYEEQFSKLNLDLEVGGRVVGGEQVNLGLQFVEDGITNILTFATGVRGVIESRQIHGVLIDVDTIREVQSLTPAAFEQELIKDIEPLRNVNKKRFFDCLTEETIKELGPTYE